MLFTRSRVLAVLAVASASAVIAACSLIDLTGMSGCAGVGYWALFINIHDQFGQPQALGAKVTLTDGDYTEVDSTQDTLSVGAAEERGGRTYDIRVSKPFYNDVVIRGVKTRGGGCVTGHEVPSVTTTIPVTLTLVPGAPPVRAMRFWPTWSPILDRAPRDTLTFKPIFDADRGVSRAVTWSITGDTAGVSLDRATGKIAYRCQTKSDSVIVTARSVVDTTISFSTAVRYQGHPVPNMNPADPPC